MVLPLRFQFPRCLTLACLMAGTAMAAETGWDERLAQTFSARLKEIQKALDALPQQLDCLPRMPIDDQGGTGGFASVHPRAVPEHNARNAVEIRWPVSIPVDLVALVPARRYDAGGLDPHYGLPDAFTVELIDSKGARVACVAREKNVRAHPVRMGHPFVYQVSPPVEAAGLRISADRLHPDPESDETFVHAWAEAFVFEGERNVARDGQVQGLGGVSMSAPWHWNAAYLIDGQTPLGLPEIPDDAHRNIGWISEGRTKADSPAALTVDLAASVSFDAVRLLPAKRPTSDLPSGFGFPRKLVISTSATGESGERGEWSVLAERELSNPGHNPVLLPFAASRARYLKIEATHLWKAFESYPAFFALSEVEVLIGNENLAFRKPVRSSDGMLNLIAPGGRFWSTSALSDGFGPDGRLVPTREWLTQLDRRLQLETRRHALTVEAAGLVHGWRRAGLAGSWLLGLVGTFLIIFLPLRYRRHANRELLKVRERIASDLHDEVGSNLGSIQMFADLAEGRADPSDDLKRIQRIAAETVSAVRDIVWLLRPQGDHRIGTAEHLRETSSILLETLEWQFVANEAAWQEELPDEATRHLFLFFREALHNILRHARASRVEIHLKTTRSDFQLVISDDGVGIDPARLERPATLHALRQRATALGAEFQIDSRPAEGTRLTLNIPLERKPSRPARKGAT
jgi:signal transduction histidine kinase